MNSCKKQPVLRLAQTLLILALSLAFAGCSDDATLPLDAGGSEGSDGGSDTNGPDAGTDTSQPDGGGGTSSLPRRPPTSGDETGGSWLLAVYMAADNNLDPASASDLNEIIRAGVPAGAEVLVFIDRGPEAESGDYPVDGLGSFTDAKLLSITSAGVTVQQEYGEVNSMDPARIRAFIDLASNHPADRKAFVFWDHGGSISFGDDETDGGEALSNDALAQIFVDPSTGEYTTFDLLGFDACLMSSIEALVAFSGIAPVFVASAELEPGDGWDYGGIVPVLADPNLSARALGDTIVESYHAFYLRNPERTTGMKVTQASWDTNLVSLQSSLTRLGSALDDYELNSGAGALYGVVARASANAYAYSSDSGERAQFVDLGLFLDAVVASESPELGEAAREVRTAFEALRLSYLHGGVQGSLGLSICIAGEQACGSNALDLLGWGAFEESVDIDLDSEFGADDEGAPILDLTIDDIYTDAGLSWVDVSAYAEDDTALDEVELSLTYSTETELLFVMNFSAPAWGSQVVDFPVTFPIAAAALLEPGFELSEDDFGALWFDEDTISMPVVVYDGDVGEDGEIYFTEDLVPGQLAVESNGSWAVFPWSTVAALGWEVAPLLLAYDFETEEVFEFEGIARDAGTVQLVIEPLEAEFMSVVGVATDILGNEVFAQEFLVE